MVVDRIVNNVLLLYVQQFENELNQFERNRRHMGCSKSYCVKQFLSETEKVCVRFETRISKVNKIYEKSYLSQEGLSNSKRWTFQDVKEIMGQPSNVFN